MAADTASRRGAFAALVAEVDTLADGPIPAPARPATPGYARLVERFVVGELATRGDSHGEGHARIVRDTALAILAELHASSAVPQSEAESGAEPDGESDRRVVELAALLHDVCDHKYCDPQTDKGRDAIRRRDECLRSAASAEEFELVLAIVEGVSFSKEAKGLFDRASMPPRLRALRDVVSDADKLEAIGA
ncbi:hypothetical protein T492DRAFT_864584 [Pavlovales sp. CCMP2436]|nr:hypothetical protein T492DRAFT_864584 [Pavlovales sp. CCMP2436]